MSTRFPMGKPRKTLLRIIGMGLLMIEVPGGPDVVRQITASDRGIPPSTTPAPPRTYDISPAVTSSKIVRAD